MHGGRWIHALYLRQVKQDAPNIPGSEVGTNTQTAASTALGNWLQLRLQTEGPIKREHPIHEFDAND